MSVSLARSTRVRSLPRAASLRTGFVPARSESSTPQVHPETPAYVDIPQPAQRQAQDVPIVKGILPRPRKLFRPFDPDRTSPEYLAKTSAGRTNPRPTPAGKEKEFVLHKARISEMRRRSIRESLSGIKHREAKAIEVMLAKSRAKQELTQQDRNKPEREADQLTTPTVLPIIETNTAKVLSPEELADRRARWEAKQWSRAEEKRSNLHKLYMNARDFIVTEEQLQARLDQVFDDPFWQHSKDPSVWGREGVPARIQDIIAAESGRRGSAVSGSQSYTNITRERLQLISEELTGGKMESQSRIDQREGRRSL